MSKVLVVGSLAYDSIQTPSGEAPDVLGGSANYFSMGASLYAPVNVVGVVGDDYKESDMQLLRDRKVGLDGVQKVSGSTFRWRGRYTENLNEAITLETQLNVFKDFKPHIPEHYRDSEYVFLANIDPVLQMEVLSQVHKPTILAMDTMNFWISSALSDLKKVLQKVDLLLINETELRDLTGEYQIEKALQVARHMGPMAIVVKRGEYGFMLFFPQKETDVEYFSLPAMPVHEVIDPTGAGDTFAAGFFGYLAKSRAKLEFDALKNACIHGCVLASFTIQDFSLNSLKRIQMKDVEHRLKLYKQIVDWPR